VVGCHVVLEPHTRVSRGFAFVTMDTVEEADRCIKYLNNSAMEGRTITVEKVIVFTFTRIVDTNSETTYVLRVDLEVFLAIIQKILCKLCAAIKILSSSISALANTAPSVDSPKSYYAPQDSQQLNIAIFSTKPECSPSTNQRALPTH
jgi:transformer-2 protein